MRPAELRRGGAGTQLCLENSSPDIYDYDGPSLVDPLWNINKLNRFQIIVTTELNPRLWSRAMDVSLPRKHRAVHLTPPS